MSDLLSVVMPAYNGERFIAAALESIRAQAVEGLEVVVVDDGSTDGTLDIVRRFAKSLPIRLITPGRIGNWVAVSDLGLRHATGDWACLLHQDDLWLPGRIARLRREIARAEGALVLHNAIFVGPDGERLGPWTCPLPEGLVPSELFLERLLVQNFIAIPSPVFRRTAALDSGGLDQSLWFSADWDLWLRLGGLGPVRFAAETLSAFRIHPSSQTMARRVDPGEWQQQLLTVFDSHFPLWKATGERRAQVQHAAMTSLAINVALSAASRGERVGWTGPLLKFCALGPSGWRRYLRDSRIAERIGPRLKLKDSLIDTSLGSR